MAAAHSAELHIVQTSPECFSLRLVAHERTVFTTRCYACGEALSAAEQRVATWAQQHHYRIVETGPHRRAS